MEQGGYNPCVEGSEKTTDRADAAPTIREISGVASALSDPVRVRILDLVSAGRDGSCLSPVNEEFPEAICPSDLSKKLGGMAGSKLSYHLKELKEIGLVREHRSGRRIYYAPDVEALCGFLDALEKRYS